MSILLCTCHPQMKINRGIEMNQTLTAVWGNMDNIYFISKVEQMFKEATYIKAYAF